MAGPKKFARHIGGSVLQEIFGVVTAGTSANAGDIVALDDNGLLDASIMPVGVGADVQTGTAAEAITNGDFVSFTPSGVKRAQASSTGTDADGFVKASVASGATATVYLEGRNTALSGLTVGGRVYLSDSTPGGFTQTAVTGTGKRSQFLGRAITSTTINFEPDDSILLA